MKHTGSSKDYIIMFMIMILSGLLSTMNVWADTVDDMHISINDIYMILLMSGWMFAGMGVVYMDINICIFGTTIVLFSIWCIRTQFMVTPRQFMMGMIPHHSMAIHMSKKLIQNHPSPIGDFAKQIIHAQKEEIGYMKRQLQNA
jgi:hypothetical protein